MPTIPEASPSQHLFDAIWSSDLSDRTKSLYEGHIRDFVAIVGGDPTPDDISVYREWLLTRGLQPSSINVALHAVRFVLRQQRSRTELGGLELVSTPRLKDRERRVLSLEEARALVAACSGPAPTDLRDKAICVVGLRTGMNRYSLVRLKVTSNFNSITVPFPRHVIAFDDETVDAIQPWTAWLDEYCPNAIRRGYLFRSLSRERVDGTRKVSKSLSEDGLYCALALRAKRAGIRDFSVKLLHNTYVDLAVRYGVPASEIASMTARPAYASLVVGPYMGGIPSLIKGDES